MEIAFKLHILFTAIFGNNSTKNLAVLMLEDLNSKYLIKLFNKGKQYREYFGELHDLYRLAVKAELSGNNYECELGLTHDGETSNGYVSGNGVLYTAYRDNLSQVEWDSWYECLKLIEKRDGSISSQRYKNNPNPDSLDNMIGFKSLGILKIEHLENGEWYYNGYSSNEHTWFQCIKESVIVYLRSRDLTGSDKRNYWHENGYYAVGKVANLIPHQYRYYFESN